MCEKQNCSLSLENLNPVMHRGGHRKSPEQKQSYRYLKKESSDWKPYSKSTPEKPSGSNEEMSSSVQPTAKDDSVNGTSASSLDKSVLPETSDQPIKIEEKPLERRREHFPYTGKQGEKKFSGRCRLFIANMNNSTTEEDLRDLFSQYGEAGEVYVNNQKGFGFIRLDYRHNAEVAKSCLDKKMFKGRMIQVRFATHASAIELHGLDHYASNEYIAEAMSQFGNVERVVVVCDDRGNPKGHAIVEFEWKKSAQKVMDRFKEEMFVLGRLPKPVLAKPLTQRDDEEGIHESDVKKVPGYMNERDFAARFISPSSFEYIWAKKWRDLYIEEEDKKAKLEQELQDARYRLENEMEHALRQQEAGRIREELMHRQEELRKLEEDLQRRSTLHLSNSRPPPSPHQDRKRGFESRSHIPSQRRESGIAEPPSQRNPIGINNDVARQNDIILHQQAELEMRRGELLRAAGMPGNILRLPPPDIMSQQNMPQPPHGQMMQPIPGLPPGFMPGPRGMPPPGLQRPLRPPSMMPVGPGGPMPGRNMPPPRGADRFVVHKRPRRD